MRVTKGFGPPSNRYVVLEDANLAIEENEFVAVIGFSGSGKSTIMSLLGRVLRCLTPERCCLKASPSRARPPFGHGVSKLLPAAMAECL